MADSTELSGLFWLLPTHIKQELNLPPTPDIREDLPVVDREDLLAAAEYLDTHYGACVLWVTEKEPLRGYGDFCYEIYLPPEAVLAVQTDYNYPPEKAAWVYLYNAEIAQPRAVEITAGKRSAVHELFHPRPERIPDLLQIRPKLSVAEIANLVNMSPYMAQKEVERLQPDFVPPFRRRFRFVDADTEYGRGALKTNPPLHEFDYIKEMLTPKFLREVRQDIRQGEEDAVWDSYLPYFNSMKWGDPYVDEEDMILEDVWDEEVGDYVDKQVTTSELVETEEFQDWLREKLEVRLEEVWARIDNNIDENGDIYLYRAIKVSPDWLERIATEHGKHLGIYWSMEESGADVYYSPSEHHHASGLSTQQAVDDIVHSMGGPHKHKPLKDLRRTLLLTAYVPEEYVDWFETFAHQMNPDYGDEELEIRLYKNTPIKLAGMWDITREGSFFKPTPHREQDISAIKDKQFYA